mmetsp:Transcript_15184/g.38315  ORF Transcript_15184/g.38315 Transcript_15184/m.38315 type:complete len:228 (-) Transcript_15184:457-1140(-)
MRLKSTQLRQVLRGGEACIGVDVGAVHLCGQKRVPRAFGNPESNASKKNSRKRCRHGVSDAPPCVNTREQVARRVSEQNPRDDERLLRSHESAAHGRRRRLRDVDGCDVHSHADAESVQSTAEHERCKVVAEVCANATSYVQQSREREFLPASNRVPSQEHGGGADQRAVQASRCDESRLQRRQVRAGPANSGVHSLESRERARGRADVVSEEKSSNGWENEQKECG